MFNPWSIEIWRIGAIVAISFVVGAIIDHVLISLFVSVAAYLIWTLIQLNHFEHWIRTGNWKNPANISGVWGELYSHFYRLQKRSRKRKKKLVSILNRFQLSAAAMPDATVVLGEYGEIEWWNEAAVRYFGFKSPQDIGQRVDNLIRFPIFTEYYRTGDYTERVEIPALVDDTILLSVQVVPYGRSERLLVAQDITRLHRLELMRRDFIANVSHELKTPLTVVTGFIESMQDGDVACAKKWGRSLHLMQQQTTRMQSIVEDLLFLSKLETKERPVVRTPINVPVMLDSLRNEMTTLCSGEKTHKVTVIAEPSLWLDGEESDLRSAFSNLMMNALRYSPDGGDIEIIWQQQNNIAVLSVKDQGIGIPLHQIPRLTERFYRVDASRSRQSGGTGLGLAIVKHVLNRHQAQLQIKSVLDKGSTFICQFPKERVVIHSTEMQDNADN